MLLDRGVSLLDEECQEGLQLEDLSWVVGLQQLEHLFKVKGLNLRQHVFVLGKVLPQLLLLCSC